MDSQAKITLEFSAQIPSLLEINQYTAVLYLSLAILLLHVTVLRRFGYGNKVISLSPFICSAVILRFIDLVFLLIEQWSIFLSSDAVTRLSFLTILSLYLLILNVFINISAKLKLPFRCYIFLLFFFILDFIIFQVFSDHYFSICVTLNSDVPKKIQFLYQDKIFYLLFALSILLMGLEIPRLLALAYKSLTPLFIAIQDIEIDYSVLLKKADNYEVK